MMQNNKISWFMVETLHLESIHAHNAYARVERFKKQSLIKGGSWVSLTDEITTFARDKAFPNYRYYNLGFRCVQSVSE